MDKAAKFEYNEGIEKYMEELQVYELFEQLMKQLLVAKPERPLDFLIDRLNEEPSKFETSLIFTLFSRFS